MAAITKGTEFAELGQRPYIEQACWFLNGFWETEVEVVELNEDHEIVGSQMMKLKDDAEKVWAVTQKFIELDDRKDGGNELDEFKSHQLLEKFAQALTVIEMREALREIDVDSNGQMSLIEYLVFRYKRGVDETMESPQGSNEEEVAKAQHAVEEVQHALTEVQAGLEAQAQAAAELKAAEDAQKQQLAEVEEAKEAQAQAQAAVEEAEREQAAAVAELHAQEEAYHGAIASLEAKVSDESLGIVTKNRAAAELAQLKAEDPLPLSRAKITSEAALRKVGKERVKMEQKTAELEQEVALAEEKARECEAATAEAEEKQRELEVKIEELQERMDEAKAELEEIKKKGGVAQGNIWWMEREIEEAEKYLPKSKQRKA